MALETLRIFRIVTGDNTYPHSGNFTISDAGSITVDDSNDVDDARFGDFTHSGGSDVPDQDVTQTSVTGVNLGDTVDLRYKYTFSGNDGSSGTVYFVATNSQANYGPLVVSDTPLDPSVTYTFGSFNTDGGVTYSSLIVPCFVRGTHIETEIGAIKVEDLQIGIRVRTMDRGFQAIRWIGSKNLDSIDLHHNPRAKPVVFELGSLGENLPSRRLVVSPQHRMVVNSKIALRMFASAEVLVPAKKLVGMPGVWIDETPQSVEYFHILFDTHEIIFAEGAISESLYVGPNALDALAHEARAEIETLFPELTEAPNGLPLVRPVPNQKGEVAQLLERHCVNAQPLQTSRSV